MKLPEAEDQSPCQREAWSLIRALLPPDFELERWAREMGALRRRRGVKAAEVLLRVLLLYACAKSSLRGLSQWALISGWAKLNRNALRQRLRVAAPWLQRLLDWALASREPSFSAAGLKVVLVDGTRFSPPGTKGTGWCAHVLFDPGLARTLQLELTDKSGGEHLRRFKFHAGELVIGDSGYAHRRGLAHVHLSGAKFLVRTNWCNIPLETRHGRPFDLFAPAETLAELESTEADVRVQADRTNGLATLPCRLLIFRKTDEAAEAAKKKVLAEAKRQKRQVDERTLKACHYIFLLTNVERFRLDVEQLFTLYRMRWQIELGFKRWKSLLHLDEMNVREAQSVRATLLAKLLGAVLVEGIVARRTAGRHLWSSTQEAGDAFVQAIKGEHALAAILGGQATLQPQEMEARCDLQRDVIQNMIPPMLEISSLRARAA